MSILNRLANAQGDRDEAPNRELARDLAEREDRAGIRELVANLDHADQDVRSDCLRMLYEVGYLKPSPNSSPIMPASFCSCCVTAITTWYEARCWRW